MLDNPGARNFLRQVSGSSLSQASCSISRAELSLHSSWLGPPARLAFLSRDPAACSGLHASPVVAASHHPWFEVSLGCDSTPDSFASRCGSRLTRSNFLMSWLGRQAPSAVLSGCRSALTDRSFSSQLLAPHRTVSFSSVETLRRTLVCTQPLSAPHPIIADGTLS